jgi:hypothetical protein
MKLEDEVGAPTTSHSLCRFVPELWQTQLGGFCLQTLSFGRLHGNHGTHIGYGCRIPCHKGCII